MSAYLFANIQHQDVFPPNLIIDRARQRDINWASISLAGGVVNGLRGMIRKEQHKATRYFRNKHRSDKQRQVFQSKHS